MGKNSNNAVQVKISDNEEKRKIYADMLFHYSEQLKEYEIHTGTFSLAIWTALVVLLGIVFNTNSSSIRIIGLIAISCLESIFTFCFSYYSQRISYFRGYCIRMEKKLDGKRVLSDSVFYFHHNCYYTLGKSFRFSGRALEGLLLAIGCVCALTYTILVIPEFKAIIEFFSLSVSSDVVTKITEIGKFLGLVIGAILIITNIILILFVFKGVTNFKKDVHMMDNKQPEKD